MRFSVVTVNYTMMVGQLNYTTKFIFKVIIQISEMTDNNLSPKLYIYIHPFYTYYHIGDIINGQITM